MEEQKIDFFREVVRLAEARMDDMNSAFASIDNKAKVMAGFCVAVLVHLFGESFFGAVAVCSISWWVKIVAVILAIACLIVTVCFCYVALRVSELFPKGLPPSDILLPEEGVQFAIDRNMFGSDLTTMLKSLAQYYDDKIQWNHSVLDKKGENLRQAQKFLWPGLIFSLIATLIAVAMRMTTGASFCPL